MLSIILIEIITTLAKTVIIGCAIFFILSNLLRKGEKSNAPQIVFENKTEQISDLQKRLLIEGGYTLKNNDKYVNNLKGQELYIFTLDCDMDANETYEFSDEISALFLKAQPENAAVLIKLTSPGGSVNGYGLLASQVERLKSKGFHVTVAVDRIACSGGYMAACVANEIIAAPFAYIGSIGVVTEFFNFTDALKKLGIKAKEYTAGDSKRLISPYLEPTKEKEAEFKLELEAHHQQFKTHVLFNRALDEALHDEIFSGKSWSGAKAIELKLIDKLMLSEEFVFEHMLKESSGAVFEIYTTYPQEPLRIIDKVITSIFKATKKAIAK